MRVYLPVLCGVLALLQLGCGRWAKADKQIVETIEIPEYPDYSESVFNLNSSSDVTGFGGTMVIINEAVDPVDLADLLQASIDSRLAWASINRFVADRDFETKFAEGGELEKIIEVLQADLMQFRRLAKADGVLATDQLDLAARSFLESELDLLFPGDAASADRVAAQAIVHDYCEAKIWELASNSYFAERRYENRPTPMPFCEEYYENSGLLQGEACEAGLEGGNYFSCLWNNGVFKTKTFASYDDDSKAAVLELFAGDSSAAVQKILGIDASVMTFKNDRFKANSIGMNGENRSFFADNILTQSQEKNKICQLVIPDYSGLCTLFAAPEQIAALPTNLSPADLIAVVEGSNVAASSGFELPQRPDSEFSTKDIFRYIG